MALRFESRMFQIFPQQLVRWPVYLKNPHSELNRRKGISHFFVQLDPRQGLDALKLAVQSQTGVPTEKQSVRVHCRNTTFHVYSQRFDLDRLLRTNNDDMMKKAAWIDVDIGDDSPFLRLGDDVQYDLFGDVGSSQANSPDEGPSESRLPNVPGTLFEHDPFGNPFDRSGVSAESVVADSDSEVESVPDYDPNMSFMLAIDMS